MTKVRKDQVEVSSGDEGVTEQMKLTRMVNRMRNRKKMAQNMPPTKLKMQKHTSRKMTRRMMKMSQKRRVLRSPLLENRHRKKMMTCQMN